MSDGRNIGKGKQRERKLKAVGVVKKRIGTVEMVAGIESVSIEDGVASKGTDSDAISRALVVARQVAKSELGFSEHPTLADGRLIRNEGGGLWTFEMNYTMGEGRLILTRTEETEGQRKVTRRVNLKVTGNETKADITGALAAVCGNTNGPGGWG